MCSFCKTDYPHYLIKHEVATCPFKQSRYCSLCAHHGHSTSDCPDAPNPVQLKKISYNRIVTKEVNPAIKKGRRLILLSK